MSKRKVRDAIVEGSRLVQDVHGIKLPVIADEERLFSIGPPEGLTAAAV